MDGQVIGYINCFYRKFEVDMNTYKSGDVVIYGAEGVCKIVDITEKKFGNEMIQYYVLEKIGKKESLTYVPANNERSLSKLRHVLSKEEFTNVFNEEGQSIQWIDKDRDRQKAFKEIVLFGNTRELINLIKTIHLHQRELHKAGKKLHLCDERVIKDAVKIIKEEISFVFDIPKDSVHEFIVQKIEK